MKYDELIKELEKGRFSNLYLFYGEEVYLKDEAVSKITEALLRTKDFNFDLLYGSSTTAEEILGIAQTLPVFSSWRILIVKEVEAIPDREAEVLLSYIKDPSPTTCIIFLGEKVDMRKRLFSALKEKAVVVQFYQLFERQLSSWIRFRAKDLGFNISEVAIEVLKEGVGTTLGSLDNELKKLSLYAIGKGVIEEKDILKVVGNLRIPTIFNLTEAIGEKKAERAIKILRKILDEGEEPLKVLVMITRQMRLLLRALELRESGFSHDEIRVRVGISARFFGALMSQLQKHSFNGLLNAFKRLQRTDLELKTSGKGKGRILESLILDLCSSGMPLEGWLNNRA